MDLITLSLEEIFIFIFSVAVEYFMKVVISCVFHFNKAIFGV